MANIFGDPKRVKGEVRLTFTQEEMDSTDFESNLLKLRKDLTTHEVHARVYRITDQAFTKLRSKLFWLKRKKYIHDFYFNLEEEIDTTHNNVYTGSVIMCYNKVNI